MPLRNTKEETKITSCCSNSTTQKQPFTANQQNSSTLAHTSIKKTKVTVKFNCGFSNHLTIRGQGANLNWNKGIALKNIKADEWVFETDASFTQCEFKVLINDKCYETGQNHVLACGNVSSYTPCF